MRTLTVNITEKAYNRIRSDLTAALLAEPNGSNLRDEVLMKMFKAWDNDEVPELKLRSEG